MDYAHVIDEMNQQWFFKRVALDKKDVSFIANRDSFRHRLVGFMTPSYYKRDKLIKEGDLLFAYAFKEWTNEVRKEVFDYPTWILFSPEKRINEDPTLLKGVLTQIQVMIQKPTLTKEEKTLKDLVEKELSDCSYFEIPASLTSGELVYLSIIYRHLDQNPDFRLGFNLIIANPSASTEVIYLPERYWNETFKKAYRNNELI